MIGPITGLLRRLGDAAARAGIPDLVPSRVRDAAAKPADVLADIGALVTSGALHPLKPRTIAELARRLRTEGVKTHLIYLIHSLEQPDEPALIFEGSVTTWAELADRISRLANHFLASGVSPGDAVAVMLPNRPEFIEANAATIRIGGLAAFMNPRAPAPDAHGIFDRVSPKVLVTHRPDVAPEGLRTLAVGEPYESAIASAAASEPDVPPDAEGKTVIFTSGTTGRPKGAVRNLEQGSTFGALAGFLRVVPFRRRDRHMVVCPLYHSSGSGFATVATVLGNPIALVEKFSAEAFCETVQEHRITTTAVVPAMLLRLVEWGRASEYDLSSLRVVVCTGSALRPDLRNRAQEILGEVIYDLYGSTEMAWVSIASPEDHRRKPGTVGKPVPGVRVRILSEDGDELPQSEVGEIWATSDLLMDAYYDDPDLTDERMRDGYVSVKDVGYLDEDGYLFVVDRADDMIISGGVNVYPAETEIALSEHPKVHEVAVVGVPDERWGQRIVASVVASGDVDEDELIAWCKDRVSYAAVPKAITLADSLPRNDIGKVDKRRIVEEWPSEA